MNEDLFRDTAECGADSAPGFDFDAWMKLARDDPHAFEQLRQRTIHATLSSFEADTHYLQKLCGRVDSVMGKANRPAVSVSRVRE